MNLNLEDFAVKDTKRADLWIAWICERHDQVRRLGVMGALGIQFGRFGRTVRMGVVNGDEFFSGVAKIPQSIDQFCRIHFEFGGTPGGVGDRNEASAGNESASFSRIS